MIDDDNIITILFDVSRKPFHFSFISPVRKVNKLKLGELFMLKIYSLLQLCTKIARLFFFIYFNFFFLF